MVQSLVIITHLSGEYTEIHIVFGIRFKAVDLLLTYR